MRKRKRIQETLLIRVVVEYEDDLEHSEDETMYSADPGIESVTVFGSCVIIPGALVLSASFVPLDE